MTSLPISTFPYGISPTQVRDGPHYFLNKYQNVTKSSPSIYDVFAVEIVRSDSKIKNFHDRIEIPAELTKDTIDTYGLPPVLILNWMLPAYNPTNPLWGTAEEDGESYSLVFLCRLSEQAKKDLSAARAAGVDLRELSKHQGVFPDSDSDEEEDDGMIANTIGAVSSLFYWSGESEEKQAADAEKLRERMAHYAKRDRGCLARAVNPTGLHPAYVLFRRFIESPDDGSFKERLKAITRIENIDDCDFNMMIKPIAKKYNGLPFQIRDCGWFKLTPSVYNVTIDVHLFSYLSKLGLAACRDILPSLTFDVCILIQGELEDELPERMLLAARVNHMELVDALDVTHQLD